MYSQNDEEAHILAAIGDGPPGRFLDIGAQDGITNSNTRALAERGWGGVLVEAAPANVVKLLDLYGDREDISIVNAALTLWRDHRVPFYDCQGGGEATLNAHMRDRWQGTQFRTFYVQTFPLSEFLAVWPGPFAVISIDVEGGSMDLFRLLPFIDMGTRAIVVEHDGHTVEIANIGRQLGYRVADMNQENVILVKR
jgi:FkbM family methyltransferase